MKTLPIITIILIIIGYVFFYSSPEHHNFPDRPGNLHYRINYFYQFWDKATLLLIFIIAATHLKGQYKPIGSVCIVLAIVWGYRLTTAVMMYNNHYDLHLFNAISTGISIALIPVSSAVYLIARRKAQFDERIF